MSDSSDNQGKSSWITWVIAGILLIALVLFGPLLGVIIEFTLFGTGRVERFLNQIGLHDLYSLFYHAIGI